MGVEHNYYQLMNLEWYSDIDIVKKKYKQLAKIYHPDTNPKEKSAEEYFKIITQGYNILSEPLDKEIYDNGLRQFYFEAEKPKNTVSNSKISDKYRRSSETIKEKAKIYEALKNENFMATYLKDEATLSHKKRIIFSILFCLFGFMTAYNNWFINYASYNIFMALIGVFSFGIGTYLLSNNLYKKDQYQSLLNLNYLPKKSFAVKVFILMMFVFPIAFLGLMKLTAKVHLAYFYEYTKPIDISYDNHSIDQGDLIIKYEHNNKIHIRRQTSNLKIHSVNMDKCILKYSKINPNICELQLLD